MSFGKYIIVAEGDEAEVLQAMQILHRHGIHSEIAVHYKPDLFLLLQGDPDGVPCFTIELIARQNTCFR